MLPYYPPTTLLRPTRPNAPWHKPTSYQVLSWHYLFDSVSSKLQSVNNCSCCEVHSQKKSKKKKIKAQRPPGFLPTTSRLRGVCSTAVLQPRPWANVNQMNYKAIAIFAFHQTRFRNVLSATEMGSKKVPEEERKLLTRISSQLLNFLTKLSQLWKNSWNTRRLDSLSTWSLSFRFRCSILKEVSIDTKDDFIKFLQFGIVGSPSGSETN